MQESLLEILRCPVTGSRLKLQIIAKGEKNYNNINTQIISQGILWADNGLFYPVIKGVPRLVPEAMLDYDFFLKQHIVDFEERKKNLHKEHIELIEYCHKKNKRTKKSFELEWSVFNYKEDRTWDADITGMLNRFLTETDETASSLHEKLIFDAGCGNGILDTVIANNGAKVIAMDLSLSIEKAFELNTEINATFVQGDVQFPPVAKKYFDIVQCSGVLIHTNNPKASFDEIQACVKPHGKLSVWLYHPRKDLDP